MRVICGALRHPTTAGIAGFDNPSVMAIGHDTSPYTGEALARCIAAGAVGIAGWRADMQSAPTNNTSSLFTLTYSLNRRPYGGECGVVHWRGTR